MSPTVETLAYSGEVVYVFAFDIAYEMLSTSMARLLGQDLVQFSVDASKRGPPDVFFYKAQMARLPALECSTAEGSTWIDRTIKVLPIGAISITLRVPFRVDQLGDLVGLHDLGHVKNFDLRGEVRRLAEAVRKELTPSLVRPHEGVGDEETYTIFCIHGPVLRKDGSPWPSEEWLGAHRREIASLLNEESDLQRLSDQKTEESVSRNFSYSQRDMVVVDWDAALVVDEPKLLDETLYIMELANLQLAELKAYDQILDDAVDRAYRDLARRRFTRWTGIRTQRELREIRVDLARLQDELSNITKFFGDWHLALIYQGLSSRFHLSDWHISVDEKLKTLDEIYQLLQMDRNNAWMLLLEFTIVALFILDIVLIFV